MSYSRNGGATQTVVSPTINVTVKHIAQITTMTASGSVSGSFTNGSSVIIPCGVKTITFSVTTPTIDLTNSSVVFSWVKPSSWSGSSTSNSITLTTDAGQTNGQVRLDYRRADGAFIQSFTVNIVRPRVNNPLINGGALQVCAGAPINLTSSAGNNPTTAQWIPSGGVVVNSQTLTSATVTANSTGTILYTANNDCLSPASTPPRDIIVGIPTISFSYVNGNPSSGFNYVSTDPTLLVAGTSFSGVSYTWTIDGGSGSIYPNSGSCSAYIYGQFLRVKVTLSNSCGTGESYFFYLLDIQVL